jgi:hypothetical protein
MALMYLQASPHANPIAEMAEALLSLALRSSDWPGKTASRRMNTTYRQRGAGNRSASGHRRAVLDGGAPTQNANAFISPSVIPP